MRTKEAKASALREGLKKYVGNLTGKRVRDAKKAREATRAKGSARTGDAWKWRDEVTGPGGNVKPGTFEDHIMSNRAVAIENQARLDDLASDKIVRSLSRKRDMARGGTALAVGGGAFLAKKKSKGKEKTASVALISPVTLIAMREEFQDVYEKEAEKVAVKTAKARLANIIKSKISR